MERLDTYIIHELLDTNQYQIEGWVDLSLEEKQLLEQEDLTKQKETQ